MSFVEFLGFTISLIAMLFLMIRNLRTQRRRQLNPTEMSEEELRQERAVRELLRAMHVPVEDEEEAPQPSLPQKAALPPPPPQPSRPIASRKDKFHFSSRLDNYQKETAIERRALQSTLQDPYAGRIEQHLAHGNYQKIDQAYEIKKGQTHSRITTILKSLHSPRDMLIIKEIFGPPKGMRQSGDDFL